MEQLQMAENQTFTEVFQQMLMVTNKTTVAQYLDPRVQVGRENPL
jgi:hypothetical protein